MNSKRRNIRMIPLTAIFGIVSTTCAVTSSASATDVVEVRYSIPTILTKLILVDDGNIQRDLFHSELKEVAQIHLMNFFLDELPSDSQTLNRNQFRAVTLEGGIEQTPVDVDANSTSIHLSVMKSDFQGYATFAIPNDLAQNIVNSNALQSVTLNAFRQNKGFWDFAEMILDNNVLKRTGKIQIAVGEVLVAEADLAVDRPNNNNDEDDDSGKSVVAVVMIYVSIIVVVAIAGLVLLICYFRRQEKELERKSMERREQSRKARLKGLGITDSSSSMDGSISTIADDTFYCPTSTTCRTATRPIDPVNSTDSNADFLEQVSTVEDIIASDEAERESRKNFNDSIDRVTEELIKLEHTNPINPFHTSMNNNKPPPSSSLLLQHDDEDSEFFSVQSTNESEREETITELPSGSSNAKQVKLRDKNSIVSVEETQIRRPQQKRKSSVTATTSSNNNNKARPLKPAIKNSNDGRQYIATRYLRNSTYNNNMSMNQLHNSIRGTNFANINQSSISPTKSKPKMGIKQKMNLGGTTGGGGVVVTPTMIASSPHKGMVTARSSPRKQKSKLSLKELPLSSSSSLTSPTKVTAHNSARLRYLNGTESNDNSFDGSHDLCFSNDGLDGFMMSRSTLSMDFLDDSPNNRSPNQSISIINHDVNKNTSNRTCSTDHNSSISLSSMSGGKKTMMDMETSFRFT